MIALYKKILQHPKWFEYGYLFIFFSFFSTSSFLKAGFYLKLFLVFIFYHFFLKPYLRLIAVDLFRKAQIPINYFFKLMLINSTWFFLLPPIDLLLSIRNGYDFSFSVYAFKLLIFIVLSFMVFFTTVKHLNRNNKYVSGIVFLSMVKNIFILWFASFAFGMIFLVF